MLFVISTSLGALGVGAGLAAWAEDRTFAAWLLGVGGATLAAGLRLMP